MRQWHRVSFPSWLQPGGPEAESGDPSAVTSLTIQMDSLTFDQSEIASEGSYEASLDRLEDSGASLAFRYPVMIDPSGGLHDGASV